MHAITPRTVLGTAQLATSAVEGVALSTVALHATVDLGFAPSAVGLMLGGGAVASMVLVAPLGVAADRFGLTRSLAAFAALGALALTGYALASTGGMLAGSVAVFAVAQASAAAVRQALAVQGARQRDRLVIRATMHTLANAGFGAGTAVGALLAASGFGVGVRIAYAVGAVTMLVTAVAALSLPAARAAGAAPVRRWAAFRDRRFAASAALASVIQLTMPILSVILPLWLLQHTSAPNWLPGAALALNTALVIGAQRPLAARVSTPSAAVRAALVGGAGLTVAGALFATSTLPGSGAGVVAVTAAGIAALTVGEVCAGLATWSVALGNVPEDAEAAYQGAFAMSTSVARIVGPTLALPLVLSAGAAGWAVLAVAMAASCVGIAVIAARPTPRPERASRSAHQRTTTVARPGR